ncbi:hypothetical protein ACFORG_06355 [Lutimaribacter marinistellae]|uniref:Uncharacterized protein n=1 Tax=Lutimaribacter marinistellae TaxID=1820329 RepID=A0ABV7THT8_9RHOB
MEPLETPQLLAGSAKNAPIRSHLFLYRIRNGLGAITLYWHHELETKTERFDIMTFKTSKIFAITAASAIALTSTASFAMQDENTADVDAEGRAEFSRTASDSGVIDGSDNVTSEDEAGVVVSPADEGIADSRTAASIADTKDGETQYLNNSTDAGVATGPKADPEEATD